MFVPKGYSTTLALRNPQGKLWGNHIKGRGSCYKWYWRGGPWKGKGLSLAYFCLTMTLNEVWGNVLWRKKQCVWQYCLASTSTCELVTRTLPSIVHVQQGTTAAKKHHFSWHQHVLANSHDTNTISSGMRQSVCPHLYHWLWFDEQEDMPLKRTNARLLYVILCHRT